MGIADEVEFRAWHTDHYERHDDRWQVVVWSQSERHLRVILGGGRAIASDQRPHLLDERAYPDDCGVPSGQEIIRGSS